MTVLRDARLSFARGEVSEDIRFRSDLAANRTGLRRCRNFVVRPTGGLRRRAGTKLMGFAKGADARLMPFAYSKTDARMVEWGPLYARFWSATGPVLAGASPLEVATPYTAEDVARLVGAQSGNVRWLFSGRRPRELRRTAIAPDGFALVEADIRGGPFLPENTDETHTIAASGVTGAVTLTASKATFQPGHSGALWRLDERDWAATPQWVGNIAIGIGHVVRYAGHVYVAETAGTTTLNPPVHVEGSQSDGRVPTGVVWRYLHSGHGIVRIATVLSATQATAVVLTELPAQVASGGTARWREGAWSDVRGWPTAGALFQQRLWAARDFTAWASAIQGFNEWGQGDLDDAALSRDLMDGEVPAIQWLAAGPVLTVGTTGPEYVLRPASGSRTVTPGSLESKATTQETAATVPGLVVGDRLLFVDGSRRRLVAHFYDFATDAYAADDLSLLSEHLLAPGVVAMAWQQRPDRVLWLLMGDGSLVSVTYNRRQEVIAFAGHHFGDPVESIAVMPSAAGDMDTLWLIVNRGGLRCIEVLMTTFPHVPVTQAEAWFLDCGLRYEGPPVDRLTDIHHLEGRTVLAVVDGAQLTPRTVAGGRVQLDGPGSVVTVGLPFTSELQTLPFDLAQAGASLHGRTQTLTELRLLMGPFASGRVIVGGGDFERIQPLGGGPDSAVPPLRRGSFSIRPPKWSGTNDEIELRLVFDDAYPATVYGIVEEREI